jgi:NitT/TauT family transport system substrate-binding protein
MPIRQSRRDFLTALSAASVAGVLSARASLAEEGPPETTTIRIGKSTGICVVPSYIADDLLRLEGFSLFTDPFPAFGHSPPPQGCDQDPS